MKVLGLTFRQQIMSSLICAAVREAETALACYNSIYANVPGQPIWAVAENYRFEPAFVEVHISGTFFLELAVLGCCTNHCH